MPARRAEFLQLQPVLILLLVLRGRIVPVFAVAALQRDDFAHEFNLDTASTGNIAVSPSRLWRDLQLIHCPMISYIVFNEIVAYSKFPFIFNNIVALMCRSLYLNGFSIDHGVSDTRSLL